MVGFIMLSRKAWKRGSDPCYTQRANVDNNYTWRSGLPGRTQRGCTRCAATNYPVGGTRSAPGSPGNTGHNTPPGATPPLVAAQLCRRTERRYEEGAEKHRNLYLEGA